MPMGPTPIAFLSYAGIKFGGYVAAGYALQRAYPRMKIGPLMFGALRTGVGIVAGLSYSAMVGAFIEATPMGITMQYAYTQLTGDLHSEVNLLVYLGLILVRLLEWSLMILFLCEGEPVDGSRLLKLSALGIVWSYALDGIALLTNLIAPGMWWVC